MKRSIYDIADIARKTPCDQIKRRVSCKHIVSMANKLIELHEKWLIRTKDENLATLALIRDLKRMLKAKDKVYKAVLDDVHICNAELLRLRQVIAYNNTPDPVGDMRNRLATHASVYNKKRGTDG
jgi:hypothetical protein